MGTLRQHFVFALVFTLSSITVAPAQESAKSSPKDTTPYSRPLIPADTAVAPIAPAAVPGVTSIVRIVDTVVNNTDATLQNTDTFNDGETSIAVNPSNPNEIVISAFSSTWNAGNAAIWHSTNSGQTWTKRFTIPQPFAGAGGMNGCPCDQTFDYGRNNVLFGVFLVSDGNIYAGSTSNPASAAAWSWWQIAGVTQRANLVATSVNNADQPWLLHNIGTGAGTNENVFVGYDDFGTNPVNMRVTTSINQVPPQFTVDQLTGSAAGAINPGHRLAQDPRNGWIYSLYQNCITNCNNLADNPKTIEYHLNRSIDQGTTWTLNSSATGIIVATADSTQPQPKFGTVNALLGGVTHAAVDPSTGDLYYVYGNRDAGGNNRLAIRRVFDNGSGGVTIGAENFVVGGTVQAALPSVAVTSKGAVGVLYYTFNGVVSGFPQFSTWLAVSTDQGATFTTQSLSTFLSPATDNGNGRQRVYGDYMQMKSVGDCFYGAFTGNGAVFGRSVSNNDPIFFQACQPSSTQSTATHDFNGDGKSDILLRRLAVFPQKPADLVGWLMNGATIVQSGSFGAVGNEWTIVGQRDFNGDGKHDLLWRQDTGTVAIWLLNGLSVSASGSLGVVPTNWSVAGTGDFNRDGKGDILWRDSTTGTVAIWLLNGLSILQTGTLGAVPSNWTIVGTGDFDGDGSTDILWRDSSTGTVAIWLVNGLTVLQTGSLGAVPSNWVIAGTGDFNGDGKYDILWRDTTTGTVAIWLLNGLSVSSSGALGAVPSNWVIAETGDFDGDGKSDILWRDTSTGTVAIWFMNGLVVTSSANVATVDTSLVIQGLNAD